MAEQADTTAAEAVELTDEQKAELELAEKQLELSDEDRAAALEKSKAAVAEARETELKAAAEKVTEERKRTADETHKARLEERYAEAGFGKRGKSRTAPERTTDDSKAAEQDGKEGSMAASDPRSSVFDAAPGKSLDDVIERNEARARGEFGDAPVNPQPAQWFVVTDELDLIEVARKLGLNDHSALGALNGRHNSVYGVQRGERVILPAEYRFDGIEGVVTEGDEVASEAVES